MTVGTMRRLSRAFVFVRYMPAQKIARRIVLTIRRYWCDRFGWPAFDAPAPSLAMSRPIPLFAPRHGSLLVENGDLVFTFLNQSLRMRDVIDWGGLGKEPAHQLWRMNLHYMEYLEAADDERFLAFIREWIAANRSVSAGAWRDAWNSYALSLRVVVWMQELRRRAAHPLEVPAAIIESLAQQLRFLANNLETDLGGNHLIKNIKALLWGAAFFVGPESDAWRTRGMQLLARELPLQILSDGMHYERSPSYHTQVFADLLECWWALGVNTLPKLDEILAPMAQALVDLTHPDGSPALFNDAGLNMTYTPAECLDVYERLFGGRPAPRRIFALDAAGYFGSRINQSYAIIDCGRLAPDDLPAHGHGDALSFEWSVGNRRVIVDPGVFEYCTGERRARSRSAMAHNTLCFEAADQADFFGSFRCGRRPDVTMRRFEPRVDGFVLEGTHDGFVHLAGAPRHVRRFEVRSDGLIVDDRIEGAPNRCAYVTFLFHPNVKVRVTDDGLVLSMNDVIIAMRSQLPIELHQAVWWPDMGVARPTSLARITIDVGVEAVLTTMLIMQCDELFEHGLQ
jgi:uncharacterized heparinase superfamily protein